LVKSTRNTKRRLIMKKGRIVLGIMVMLLIAVLVGCGGGGGGGDAQTTLPTGTTTPHTDKTPTNTDTGGSSLNQILGQSTTYESVYYEMVSSVSGQGSMTMKYWMKGDKIRIEMVGMGTITLMDMAAKTMYYYTPATNTAIKMVYDITQEPDKPGEIIDYHPNIVGTEIFDGKECTVIEYSHGGVSAKAWIWNDTGFPVKMETTAAGVTTTVVWKNFDFSNIPDSMFELPEGVEVMEFGT
jgi:hypothetical protein